MHRSSSQRLRRVALFALLATMASVPAFAQYRYPPPLYPYYGAAYARYEADLRVVVKPNEAAVYVDGYFAGQVDDFDGVFQRLHLEPGQHEIVVHLPGYRSLRDRLYFSPNQTRKITGTLERLAPGEPDEGPPVPLSPPEPPDSTRMPPGQRRGGPPPDGRPFPAPGPRPGPGQNPPPPAQVGTLSIRVQPGEAEVLIDGERWTGGPGNERLIVQLTEGRHVVEVNKPGYRRFTTEIQLRPDETVPLNVSLTPDR